MNIAFMFSGQGSQYVTMGKELYEAYPKVQELFSRASKILGYDVLEVLFENEEKLNDTLYTQPMMFVLYASILEVLKEKNISSTLSFGLSLGEYGALYDASCFTFEQGLDILQHRGTFMNEAASLNPGKMSAILGLEEEVISKVLDSVGGYVTIANYNTDGQIVISGEESAVLEANDLLLEAGAKRAIPLNTSGAFHSEMMIQAKEAFNKYLDTLELNEPNKKVIMNVTGDYFVENLKELMSNQIMNSVRFTQSIELALKDGYNCFVEIGPKKTLTSFVKKIDRSATLLNVEDLESLQKTMNALEE